MDLSVLPDERATHDPLGQAVADDISDLNNAEFPRRRQARSRDAAQPGRVDG